MFRPLVNNTYTPGVENTVYNALVEIISVHRRVALVNSKEDADAILTGQSRHRRIRRGSLGPRASVATDERFALGRPSREHPDRDRIRSLVVVLLRAHARPSGARQENHPLDFCFLRGKPFAGNNQLGVQGDTSVLINQSEFERALGDLAVSMMGDLHESMLAMF